MNGAAEEEWDRWCSVGGLPLSGSVFENPLDLLVHSELSIHSWTIYIVMQSFHYGTGEVPILSWVFGRFDTINLS